MSIFFFCFFATQAATSSVSILFRMLKVLNPKTKRWNRPPYELGFPVLSPKLHLVKNRIHDYLFGGQTLGIVDTDSCNYREFVHDQPVPLDGYDLFQHEARLLSGQKHRKSWLLLPKETRAKFVPYEDSLFRQNLRVWRGYEVVEYIRRYEHEYRYNPYPFLGLYPWEIIRDKLKNRKRPKVDLDYYDVLISEFLNRGIRSPLGLFTAYNGTKDFKQLSELEQRHYRERAERRNAYLAELVQAPKYTSPYLAFCKKNYRHYQPTEEDIEKVSNRLSLSRRKALAKYVAAAAHWRLLTKEQKQEYSPGNTLFFSMKYTDEILDWKVSAVMDYLYRIGGVKDAPPGFDWQQRKHEIIGDLHYIDRLYMERLIYIEGGQLRIENL